MLSSKFLGKVFDRSGSEIYGHEFIGQGARKPHQKYHFLTLELKQIIDKGNEMDANEIEDQQIFELRSKVEELNSEFKELRAIVELLLYS